MMPNHTGPAAAVKQVIGSSNFLSQALYICLACGWVYNEAEGDVDSGLAPGTAFADIPQDWACPLCGVTKADFEPFTPPDLSTLRLQAQHATGTPIVRVRNSDPGVVIVGAGHAGWQLAQTLRQANAHLPITLVSACSGHRYDKPMLSVAIARGLDGSALIRETGAAAAERLQVKLLADTHAVHICTTSQQLRTTKGTLRYRQLVLAHGAQAQVPPSLPMDICWRINHLDAYLKFRSSLLHSPRSGPQEVLIVGAGLVGCELANDLALGGHRITLIDASSTPLSRWPIELAGNPLLQAWKDLPIRFEGGLNVKQVERIKQRLRLTTDCGQRFAADHLIAATGLATPTRLAQSARLKWYQGIEINPATMATSQPNIYAMGDCISLNGTASRFIEPINRQAVTLAASLLGACEVPAYEVRHLAVRVKTSTFPLTLQALH
ncbi:MAG: rubredoxin [Betaproteobacteria bacterium]|nr:rubredoxin [Betaproteobacteria bacterium]